MIDYVIYILLYLSPVFATSCDSDYTEFNSECYFFSSDSAKFAAAELFCREKGGHLASIHDRYTNAFIAQQSPEHKCDLWIGLSNLKEFSSWKWTDDSDLNYLKWNNDSSLNISDNKNCASFSFTDNYWYKDDCYKTKPFLCQHSKKPLCEDGFVYFPETQSCYGGRGGVANWTEAEKYCETEYNASLPVIESFTEFQFVASYASAIFKDYWVGVRFSNESQTWITVSGNMADFLYWCPGFPTQETRRCIHIGFGFVSFCYGDDDCTVTRRIGNYLCKKKAHIDFKYLSCPSGYFEWKSKCYFVSHNESEFDEAESTCNKMGGDLASIHDGFENAIVSQMYIGTSPDIWIGLSNPLKLEEWEWIDNSSFNYQNWEKNKLSSRTNRNCVSASLVDGKWTAGDCEIKKPFICEIEYQAPNCSDGWFYFLATNACYGNIKAVANMQPRNYGAAQQYCKSFEANLPSIHTYAYSSLHGYWLGIRSFDGGKTWKTEDGSAADFLEYGKWCVTNLATGKGKKNFKICTKFLYGCVH